MKLKVIFTYRDDKKEEFICADFPNIGDWITLYLEDFKRVQIPREAVAKIEQCFI